MQTIRGTKDILPHEIKTWQNIYLKALSLFELYNYYEIRTPIIENTEVFIKSVGNSTDIVSKEMYRFTDQGERDICLRPEGTASIARAIASNKMYIINPHQKLWYMGPMFRYERPQQGRQRQFHQLGIECIGSMSPLADIEIINLAHNLFNELQFYDYKIQINSLGTKEERAKYKIDFIDFLSNYKNDLDEDSQKRIQTNPLRILDSKNTKTQELIKSAPCISKYLQKESKQHFFIILEALKDLNIPYEINRQLVRGLDYYDHTAFEIISNDKKYKKAIGGGGRYSNLVKQFGGPNLCGVGWAIGIERLIMITNQTKNHESNNYRFDILTEGFEAQKQSCKLIKLLAKNNILFNLNFSDQTLNKRIKRSVQNNFLGCIIISDKEISNETITIKWLKENYQETITYNFIINYLNDKLKKNKDR